MLNWAQQFGTFCFLDNHQYQIHPHTEECLLAAGVKRKITPGPAGNLDTLQQFIDAKKSWLFGHLSYDLKNEIEGMVSAHEDHVGFPDFFFFEPEYLVRLQKDKLVVEGQDAETVYAAIMSSEVKKVRRQPPVSIQQRFTKEEYIAVISRLKEHILRGDCYEINFCQEFYATDTFLQPVEVYRQLSAVSPNPFSALYRQQGHWLICASPERFLKKTGSRILSQPIKGTSKRAPSDHAMDQQHKQQLEQSTKDRSENVMVVDLVRNDLSRICAEGSVGTEELFGIYPFPQVYQMISTVSGEVKKDVSFTGIIRAAFPMGSMTGAPKKRVMELIEQYERTKRGIFSGAAGYISPEGDFDFNVVIRSIMYNEETGYLSFQAGSGITWYSEPEKEWEECMWKASAIKDVLNQ